MHKDVLVEKFTDLMLEYINRKEQNLSVKEYESSLVTILNGIRNLSIIGEIPNTIYESCESWYGREHGA